MPEACPYDFLQRSLREGPAGRTFRTGRMIFWVAVVLSLCACEARPVTSLQFYGFSEGDKISPWLGGQAMGFESYDLVIRCVS